MEKKSAHQENDGHQKKQIHRRADHKRVYRLYSAANLRAKAQKVRLSASERVPLQLARAVNDV